MRGGRLMMIDGLWRSLAERVDFVLDLSESLNVLWQVLSNERGICVAVYI
jgi:hypothetical protein